MKRVWLLLSLLWCGQAAGQINVGVMTQGTQTVHGVKYFTNNNLRVNATPIHSQEAASKSYVDYMAGTGGSGLDTNAVNALIGSTGSNLFLYAVPTLEQVVYQGDTALQPIFAPLFGSSDDNSWTINVREGWYLGGDIIFDVANRRFPVLWDGKLITNVNARLLQGLTPEAFVGTNAILNELAVGDGRSLTNVSASQYAAEWNGRILGSPQLWFSNSVTTVIPAANWSNQLDTASAWSGAAYTVPVTGVYHVTFSPVMTPTNSGQAVALALIRTNNIEYARGSGGGSSVASGWQFGLSVSANVLLPAGASISFAVFQGSSSVGALSNAIGSASILLIRRLP